MEKSTIPTVIELNCGKYEQNKRNRSFFVSSICIRFGLNVGFLFPGGGGGGVFPGNFGGGVPSSPPNPDPFSDFPHLFSDLISQLNAPQASQAHVTSYANLLSHKRINVALQDCACMRNNILRSLFLFFFSIKLGDLPLMYPVFLV